MNRRVMAAIAIWALGVAVPYGATPASQNPPTTFRGGINVVAVDVSVRTKGQPVTGLQAADFDVRDNGVKQQLIDVSYEQLPIDLTVALDVSQSVTGDLLDQMRTAVGQLRQDLGTADRLQLLTFNDRVNRAVKFSDPPSTADTGLSQAGAGGGTAFLDTLAVSLVAPVDAYRRQLVVVFSDGIDSRSISNPATVVDVARRGSATTACVLPPVTGTSPAMAQGRALCDQLAAETGGLVINLQRRQDLAPTFKRVLGDFRSSYVLHFTPSGVQASGFHTLSVRVTGRDVEVRSRKGYNWR